MQQAAISAGADLVVDGDIPSGAGLSSSSALVVATSLALLAANRRDIPFAELAVRLPKAERYVGTLSGGMDQAISLLAQAGTALRIDFFPLRTRPLHLPKSCAIVVCHSLVAAEKSGAARKAYNQRVIECRLACSVLNAALGANLPRPMSQLGDLAKLFPGRPLRDFLPHLRQMLPEGGLDLKTIAAAIGTQPDRLRADYEIPPAIERFFVVPRARHVLSEADRVEQAELVLRHSDIDRFGALMDASHASCRDDYDISCGEIERLVHLAKEAGAAGARVTGAGFGGCTVNLLRHHDVGRFLEYMDRKFYVDRIGQQDPSGYRFVFHPQAGAEVSFLE
jgi:N-acetylgalactosamine kinase